MKRKLVGESSGPAKLRKMAEKIQDKGSEEYQRIAWEALKKSIVGTTNKVNSSNISDIVVDLFKVNIIRGRGVLAKAIMKAQEISTSLTRVYAALVCVINSKFPEIGELILKRLILRYKKGFRRNDKTVCINAAQFLAHLLNQKVAHEVLILEIMTQLLAKRTEDSLEIAIMILKECGKKLTLLSPNGMRAITQSVRNVLRAGNLDDRLRYMIEAFFAEQKDGFIVDKRVHHNLCEKRRREYIKDSFSSLTNTLPYFQGDTVRASRTQVLEKSSDYIQSMQRENSAHQQDIDDLKRQNKALDDQIRRLEKAKATGNFAAATAVMEQLYNTNSKAPLGFDADSDSEDSSENSDNSKDSRRKKDFEIILKELDLVDDEDKFTHFVNLDDVKHHDAQDLLNSFEFDPDYMENEEKYKSVAKKILRDSDMEEDSDAEWDSE